MKSKLSILLLALVALLALSCANPVNPDPPTGPTLEEQWVTITTRAEPAVVGTSPLGQMLLAVIKSVGPTGAQPVTGEARTTLETLAPDIFPASILVYAAKTDNGYYVWVGDAVGTNPSTYVFTAAYLNTTLERDPSYDDANGTSEISVDHNHIKLGSAPAVYVDPATY